MKKKKKTVKKPARKDALRFVLLAWLLSVLIVPVIDYLVPVFFGGENLGVEWLLEALKGMVIFAVAVLIPSFIISLALDKDASVKSKYPETVRRTFLIAAVWNVTFLIFRILLELL